MSIRAEAVRYSWNGRARVAVDGIDLEVFLGELLAVVGPNGAGKSTLLGLLSGWLVPCEGRVRLEGRSLQQWRSRERARLLAYLPQGTSPLYDLSVYEVVASGRFAYRTPWSGEDAGDREAIARALEATDTTKLTARRFGTLSGGERQRVLVGSILAQESRWLLLDEPTGSLDLHHAVAVFQVLRAAADAGRGLAVVTHDLNLASLFADRVALLHEGRLTDLGDPGDVLRVDRLRATYGPAVAVSTHPHAGRPIVLPLRGPGS